MENIGLNELSKEIYKEAQAKGFWDNEREIGTLLMLMVSELGEALEADRKNRYADIEQFKKVNKDSDNEKFISNFLSHIKDTFEDELADTIIRILDLCGKMDIDIDFHIKQKLLYNKTRGYKHGKLY